MKKRHVIIPSLLIILVFAYAKSIAGYFNPADDYVGKYVFSNGGGGGPENVEIFLKDTTLSWKTPQEEGTLTKLAVDSFAYKGASEGTVAFKRNEAKKVDRMLVYTMDGYVLEATKEQ
jgi:hypothetical protein